MSPLLAFDSALQPPTTSSMFFAKPVILSALFIQTTVNTCLLWALAELQTTQAVVQTSKGEGRP